MSPKNQENQGAEPSLINSIAGETLPHSVVLLLQSIDPQLSDVFNLSNFDSTTGLCEFNLKLQVILPPTPNQEVFDLRPNLINIMESAVTLMRGTQNSSKKKDQAVQTE